MLMLWVSGGPSLQAWATHTQEDLHSALVQHSDDETPDESDQLVLTSLEAGIVPVCKIQVAFFGTFVRELARIEPQIEQVAGDIPLPQSSYLRTLFQRIISPNAP